MGPADQTTDDEPMLLTTATVLDLQLELIRRRRFNRFYGPRVVASLQRHRDLWRGVDFRCDGLPPDEGRSLGAMSLIGLRDVPDDRWKADTLYVLCDGPGQASAVLELANRDGWHADVAELYAHKVELASALGTSEPAAVAGFWWD